jgi:hypothetical protein
MTVHQKGFKIREVKRVGLLKSGLLQLQVELVRKIQSKLDIR